MIGWQKGFSSIIKELIYILILTSVSRVVSHVDIVSQIIISNLSVGIDTSEIV